MTSSIRALALLLPLLVACDWELQLVQKPSITNDVQEVVGPAPTPVPPINEPSAETHREPPRSVAIPEGVDAPDDQPVDDPAELPPQPLPIEVVKQPVDVYTGVHKLGVNRVTNMARVGTVTFTRKGGSLQLQGRVQRGKHWLTLSGEVDPVNPKVFHLIGTIEGIPDMAWANEVPRVRRTEARFTFEVRHNRPYWRMYKINGRDCVCDDNCGNDFCYIDIERQPTQ